MQQANISNQGMKLQNWVTKKTTTPNLCHKKSFKDYLSLHTKYTIPDTK